MVRLLLLLALVAGAKPDAKVVITASRKKAFHAAVEQQAKIFVLQLLEDLACVEGSPWPTTVCALAQKQVDDAKSDQDLILQEHAPHARCETLWILSVSERSAAKEMRAKSDAGRAFVLDAGSALVTDEKAFASMLSRAFRGRARGLSEAADKDDSDFRKETGSSRHRALTCGHSRRTKHEAPGQSTGASSFA
jgi:hypothetical protein